MAWLSFIQLDKAVVHVIRLASFLWLWFQSVFPMMPSLSIYHLTWVSLTLDVGCLFMASPAKCSCCSWPWTWGITSQLLLLTVDVGYLLSANQVYLLTNNAEEAELEQFYEDLQYLLEHPKKDVLFIMGDWNANVGSQETTWSKRQIWPWSTEWSRAKTNRLLPRECTGHSKHPLPTTQEKTLHMDTTRWPTPKSDWLYSLQPKMEKLYTVSKNKTWSWLWLRSWTPYCQSQI